MTVGMVSPGALCRTAITLAADATPKYFISVPAGFPAPATRSATSTQPQAIERTREILNLRRLPDLAAYLDAGCSLVIEATARARQA
jgi:hypothetical protein